MGMIASLAAALVVANPTPTVQSGYTTKSLKDVKAGMWEATSTYVQFNGSSELVKTANRLIASGATKDFNQFMAEAKTGAPMLKKLNSAASYYYNSTQSVRNNDGRVYSVLTETSTFTGGAHGMFWYTPRNFALMNGIPAELTFNDIFRSDINSRQQVSFELLAQLLPMSRATWVQDGEWKELTAEQANRFTIDGSKGITWHFDPYELGPWAVGTFQITVPWSRLRNLVYRTGPVGYLAR